MVSRPSKNVLSAFYSSEPVDCCCCRSPSYQVVTCKEAPLEQTSAVLLQTGTITRPTVPPPSIPPPTANNKNPKPFRSIANSSYSSEILVVRFKCFRF